MKKLTVLAAAFAAGVTTFAAKAEDITLNGEKIAALQATMRDEALKKAAADQAKAPETGRSKADKAGKGADAGEKVAKARGGRSAKTAGKAKAAAKGKRSAAIALTAKSTAMARPPQAKAAATTKSLAKAKAANRKETSGTIEFEVAKTNEAVEAAAEAKPAGSGYSHIIARYASAYGVPVSLANAVIRIESNYRPNALGRAGEIGLMQIKPSTARMMGYSGSAKALYNPETNIKFGMKYLGMARQLGGGTTCGTILKYNAGHAATRMNPVSSAYCSKVKRHLAGA